MEMLGARRVAVIGAGLAGATCAHALMQAGHQVHLFDKSRGPGGRLATRRVEWTDPQGQACSTPLDHGTVALTARTAPFRSFIDQALQAGWLATWAPALAYGSQLADQPGPLYVPVPDLPALCRHLLHGAPATWSLAVDGLHRRAGAWQVQAGAAWHPATFDAVVLALPPAQAVPLLGPHRPDWARQASAITMQPCWTLMGIASEPAPALGWDLARPATGPLAWVLRNDARPGRARVAGQAHWVVHARPAWSLRCLEDPAVQVQQALQAALAAWLGQPVQWHHSLVHRWRYAQPQAPAVEPAPPCWWDGSLGLGACGDHLGGSGAEGAWLSAQSLCAALLH